MTQPESLDLQQLREVAETATLGPWFTETDGIYDSWRSYMITPTGDSEADRHDAAFIAAANPETILALVEVCQAAQEVGDSNFRKLLELLGREGHDEAALRVLNFRKALAKLDNLGGTE